MPSTSLRFTSSSSISTVSAISSVMIARELPDRPFRNDGGKRTDGKNQSVSHAMSGALR